TVTATLPTRTWDKKAIKHPVKLSTISVNNAADKGFLSNASFLVDEISVVSEISDLDTDAFSARIMYPRPYGIFSPRDETVVMINIISWAPYRQNIRVRCKVRDFRNKVVYKRIFPLKKLKGARLIMVKMPELANGGYTGKMEIIGRRGPAFRENFYFVITPENRNKGLKKDSPFGVNLHCSEPYNNLFARIGVKYTRTYGWTPGGGPLDWGNQDPITFRAGGKMYNRIDYVSNLMSQGVYDMPTVRGVNNENAVNDELMGPPADYEAYSEMISKLAETFKGKIPWVEPYNEPNLDAGLFGGAENFDREFEKVQKAFYKGIKSEAPNMRVAYTGMAGFEPDYYYSLFKKDLMKHAECLNGHMYCIDQPPETSKGEGKTGLYYGDVYHKPWLLLDRMRQIDRIRDQMAPSKEIWLSEFGWTDKVNLTWKVGQYLQACYGIRTYLLGMSEDIDKLFWYFWGDTEYLIKVDHYFGGMGFFNLKWHPKPIVAAFNTLTSVMADAEYVGDLPWGKNVYARVFKNSKGRPVVAVWHNHPDNKYDRQKTGPELQHAVAYLDIFGNKKRFKQGEKITVGNDPVYLTGLQWSDPLLKPAALRENALINWISVAGSDEDFTLTYDTTLVKTSLNGKVIFKMPSGFKVNPSTASFNVAAGRRKTDKFRISIPYSAQTGVPYDWELIIKDRSGFVKHYYKKFTLADPINVALQPFYGKPEESPVFSASLKYEGSKDMNITAKMILPPDLEAVPPQQNLNLKPESKNKLEFTIKKTGGARGKIYTNMQFLIENKKNNFKIEKKVIPGFITIKKLPREKITLDGKLSDWGTDAKDKYRIPDSILHHNNNAAGSIRIGWNEDGLLLAITGKDKAIKNTHKTFWTGDYIEIWADLNNSKSKTFGPGIHQFFITLPGIKDISQTTPRIGQWSRQGDDIKETIFDLETVQSGFQKSGDQWTLELFLPRKVLHGFQPQSGKEIGLNINIMWDENNQEVSWFLPKSRYQDMSSPSMWGTAELSAE
ncbi:MAG TPA: sugar-binding protein, partial [Spirochaetota bacterium]|nr:sugar-binding protein [Spirochaetota bacterium]